MTTATSVRVLCAVGAAVTLCTATSAVAGVGTHAPGCRASSRYGVGDPRRVYDIPGGCIWLMSPSAIRASFGPVVKLKIDGKARTEPLGRDPFGDANGYCGVSSFYVSGRYVTVTASRAWLGQSTGCVPVSGGEMVWFERIGFDGWLHQIATSAPWHSP